MKELKTENAIIESATITNDDHGILTAYIDCKFRAGGCGFGGFALYVPSADSDDNARGLTSNNYAGHFIWRAMEIAGVSRWEDLKGKTIRVRNEGIGGRILEIGHIINDDWFDPKKDFKS